MKKAAFEGFAIIAIFLVLWFLLQQINWMETFKIEQNTKNLEQKLGDLFWETFQETEEEISDSNLKSAVDSIISHICKKNSIDKEKIKLHFLRNEEVNAFALPGGHLIVYSGLINQSENQQEFTGVLCHEIAHLELNHVMRKLVKEIGLSTLFSMTGGNNGQIVRETAQVLSSTAFDRKLEKEADLKSVEYMIIARVDPRPYADFLYRMASEDLKIMTYIEWINTHPESKERAEYIIESCKDSQMEYSNIITAGTWSSLKKTMKP